MSKLVQFDFKFAGPFGEELTNAMEGLAQSINQEPGFIWKIWTENAQTGEAGGIYIFTDEASATAYISKHSERLKAFGVAAVNVKIFDINEGLSRLTRAPTVS